MTRLSGLSKEHQGPRAVLNALQRIVSGYAAEASQSRQDLSIAESQLRDYQARLGEPFSHDRYLSELTALRDQLKAKLSAGHKSDEDQGPTTSELAGRIKELKSANTIEAAPQQRIPRKHAAAEEPVTSRILRKKNDLVTVPPESKLVQTHTDSCDEKPGSFQALIQLERSQSNAPSR